MTHPPQGTVRDWLDQRANEGGIAFVFPNETKQLTWAQLRDWADGIARNITEKGAAPGESIALIQPNGFEGILALFGVLYGGFRATMINLVAGDEAISYALDHSDARLAFVHDDQKELLARTMPARGIRPLNPCQKGTADLHPITEQTHALLMYTSGTTGQPKGVVHTHASLLAGGWTTAMAHGLTPQDRGLCVLPIYHINGLCVTVMGSLIAGCSLIMLPRFSASGFWDTAQAHEATWFSVVPTIISHLLHGAADPDATTKRRLRFGRSASSALPVDVHRAFEERFGVPIIETMGLTETAAQILSNPLPPAERKIGSPGQAVGNRVKIMHPKGPSNEGEIAVHGPNVMAEYLKNPQATADTFTRDGWLLTGDLGRMDADGYVYVTGRLKELIIKGGENIAPREIDEALYSHADVVEAAAFARPCATYGETVEAAVKLRSGSGVTPHALIDLCHTRLGRFKSPDVIHILDDLPKGPSGKIQRRKLTELPHKALG
ncbi:AMP-binding protein [Algirhabdus cladophorae]|uniref:AMP-binding protein n=1 Tax=Algirhabdus cladophorae TaxID=3377108 RepID=UPI003B847680